MNHYEYINKILDMFGMSFISEYNRITYRKKTEILKYYMAFYRRWYYSALVEDTILSPATITSHIYKEMQLMENQVSYPIIPKKGKLDNFKFKTISYSLDNHPIINDLKQFVKFCVPDIELTEENVPLAVVQEAILECVSIPDPYYVEYLSLLAFELKILKKIPSIYSYRAQLTPALDELLTLSNREIFIRIFEASISIASNYFCQSLPTNNKQLDSSFIINILKEPISTDELFQRIYTSLGMRFDEMLDFNGDAFDDLYNAMVSSTFFLGLIIDRYFFTIFGFYLKLILPTYTLTFDMHNELDYVIDGIRNSDDISTGLFAPCSHYTLTSLGLELLDVKPTIYNKLTFPPEASINSIMSYLSYNLKNPKSKKAKQDSLIGVESMSNRCNVAYLFKITILGNKTYWKSIEFDDKASLHLMYLAICNEFYFSVSNNYSFFKDGNESPFFEYSSPTNKRRTKKSDEHNINEIAETPKDKCLLVLYDTLSAVKRGGPPAKEIKIELNFVRQTGGEPYNFYPNVKRVSAAFEELEFDDIFR